MKKFYYCLFISLIIIIIAGPTFGDNLVSNSYYDESGNIEKSANIKEKNSEIENYVKNHDLKHPN